MVDSSSTAFLVTKRKDLDVKIITLFNKIIVFDFELVLEQFEARANRRIDIRLPIMNIDGRACGVCELRTCKTDS